MKDVRAVVAVTIAISMAGCSEPDAVLSGPTDLVPMLEICASETDQYARRGRHNFEPNGNRGVEARAIFYRAKLHASNGVADRQIALWADQGEDPLPVSPSQMGQQEILRQCETAFEARQTALPAGDQEAAETCYVAAKFMRSVDLDDLIIRRFSVNNGRLASIARASARQSRDENDTFLYLDTLGKALTREPLDHTVDSCRRRFTIE